MRRLRAWVSAPLPPRARFPGCAGVAAGPEVAIIGGDGGLLPPDELGEVVTRGRPMEIDALLGAVVELGALTGHPMPACELVLALIRQRARAAGCYQGARDFKTHPSPSQPPTPLPALRTP